MDEIAQIVEDMRDYADTRLAPTTAVACRMYEFIRRIEAALAAIPEGWVLVPVEPTDEMISAGVFAHRNDGYRGMPMHAAWAAMVAASPPLAAIGAKASA